MTGREKSELRPFLSDSQLGLGEHVFVQGQLANGQSLGHESLHVRSENSPMGMTPDINHRILQNVFFVPEPGFWGFVVGGLVSPIPTLVAQSVRVVPNPF